MKQTSEPLRSLSQAPFGYDAVSPRIDKADMPADAVLRPNLAPLATKPMRKIVKVDEEKCDGCGTCISHRSEGALLLINGKAKLAADEFCDGLGDCIGICPKGAIVLEEREARAFGNPIAEAREHADVSNAKAAFRQRLSICCRASECGRICDRLVKNRPRQCQDVHHSRNCLI